MLIAQIFALVLIIAVMFTFSFGSAFAAGGVDNSADANMIKQAADYVKAGLPEAVQKAYKSVLTGGTANTYITEAAWEAAAADIVDSLSDDIDSATDTFLNTTAPTEAGWNSYDYVYAASVLYPNYTYTKLATDATNGFDKNGSKYALMAAKEQFKLDLADAMSVYDKVDLDALYSKTEPTTGATYYEQAAEKLQLNKEALNGFYFTADGSVTAVGTTVSTVENEITAIKGWIGTGVTGAYNLTAVKAETYTGTSVAKYYYVDGIPTLDSIKVDEAINAAKTATIKAQVAKNVALFLKDHSTTEDKEFAENYTTLYNYLADKIPAVAKLSNDVAVHETSTYPMTTVKSALGNSIATAIDNIKLFEREAAKYAAEKDATGALVRDSAEVDKLVNKAKVYTYASAVSISDSTISVYTTSDAIREIKGMTTAGDAAKLAFDKEAEKAKLDSYMNGTATTIPTGFVVADDYYDLEAAAVKAAYEAAKAKVDAATKASEFSTIETALKKELDKIKTDTEVEALYASTTTMGKELKTQAKALASYVTYKNSALKPYDDAYVLGGGESNAERLLMDYFIENNARTLAEMKALTGAVEAVAATLPTNASLATAKKAADDAIKALPSIANTTSADKDAYQAAFDLANAYNDLVEIQTGTAGTLAIDGAKVNALKQAIQDDFTLAYAKTDKTDKAALKAISADVEAANDEVGDDELFTTEFTDPTTGALGKIRQAERDAVIAAINAIPMNVTEADKATVQKARELYDAFVAEYTDYEDAVNGYVASEFAAYYHDLALAEAALGLNYDAEENAKAYVQDLKIAARSTKTSKGVKVTINADVQPLLDAGFTVEYKFYRSTKSNKNFGTAKVTKTENTYLNTSGKKGTKYYYKAKLVVKNAAGEVIATTPLTQCLYATRTF